MRPITFVDIETDGRDNPAPIEIAALRLTSAWTIERAFYRRWQPAQPVEPDAAKKNGYNEHDWEGCEPVRAEDLIAFGEFIAGSQWAGAAPIGDVVVMDAMRIGACLPRWDVSGHKPDLLSLGRPLVTAVGGTGSNQTAVLGALAEVGRPVPLMPEWLAALARGRTGVHTAMGDAWNGTWALRHLWTEAEDYWRGQKARAT